MDTQNQSNRRTVRNLAIFICLVIALGWLGWWVNGLTAGTDAEGIGLLIFIISPLLACLVLRASAGDGWQDMGLEPTIKDNGLWYVVSILVYPVAVTLAFDFRYFGIAQANHAASCSRSIR